LYSPSESGSFPACIKYCGYFIIFKAVLQDLPALPARFFVVFSSENGIIKSAERHRLPYILSEMISDSEGAGK
jgi:hypothetical protein